MLQFCIRTACVCIFMKHTRTHAHTHKHSILIAFVFSSHLYSLRICIRIVLVCILIAFCILRRFVFSSQHDECAIKTYFWYSHCNTLSVIHSSQNDGILIILSIAWQLYCDGNHTAFSPHSNPLIAMGWLRLVGCLKIQVSLQNTGLFGRALLQKRPIVLSILLIVATPNQTSQSHCILIAFESIVGAGSWSSFAPR